MERNKESLKQAGHEVIEILKKFDLNPGEAVFMLTKIASFVGEEIADRWELDHKKRLEGYQ